MDSRVASKLAWAPSVSVPCQTAKMQSGSARMMASILSSSNRAPSRSAMLTQPRAASISPSTLSSLFFTFTLLPDTWRFSTLGALPSAFARAASTCFFTSVPYRSRFSGWPVSRVNSSSNSR